MSERRRIFSGSTFVKIAGYANAVVDGDRVHVSGCTGTDYASGEISDDAAEQTHQVFRNINWALAQAGTPLDDMVNIRVYLDSRDDFAVLARCWTITCAISARPIPRWWRPWSTPA